MSEHDTTDDLTEPTLDSTALAVASTYKVLGEFADGDGAGVLGKNNADSGTPIGVQGAVPNSSDGYGLATPDDAKIEGALATTGTHAVGIDGKTALEIGPESFDDGLISAGQFVAGYSGNVASSPGGVVGGGGRDTEPNEAMGGYATIAGGRANTAGGLNSTVGGGRTNEATGEAATVAGGFLNDATAPFSTIGGGSNNAAEAEHATVGGGDNNEVKGAYATIGGGGQSDPNDFLTQNIVYDDYGTIGGGGNNQAGSDDGNTTSATYATVGGGNGNTAGADNATVGGGSGNQAGGGNATVAGGIDNDASAIDTTVGGGRSNTAGANVATVAGGNGNTASGIQSFVGSGKENRAKSGNAVIVGGFNNVAIGGQATITGGYGNRVFDDHGTVAGGQANQAGSDDSGSDSATDPGNQNTGTDTHATVGGGHENVASGAYATVPGGRKGEATNDGSFVWADSTDATFASDQSGTGSSPTGADTFHVRATGGVRFVTGLDSNDDPDAGQYLSAGGSSWQTVSARAAKQEISPVDPETVLSGVEALEISTWEYEANEGVRRMGPMAGEFHDTFGLGDDPETIGHVDADGVAFAAIQGLSEKLDEREKRIDELEATLDERAEQVDALEAESEAKEDRIDDLEERLAEKDDRIDELEQRLAALESQVETTAHADD